MAINMFDNLQLVQETELARTLRRDLTENRPFTTIALKTLTTGPLTSKIYQLLCFPASECLVATGAIIAISGRVLHRETMKEKGKELMEIGKTTLIIGIEANRLRPHFISENPFDVPLQ